jgi:ABC-type phosphate transport system substrate-binding protein
MSVRKFSARMGLAVVAASGLALAALGPAHADTEPGVGGVDGSYTLGSTVIGVGSDTIQWVDDQLSKDYDHFNSLQTTPSRYWANFDACVGKDVGGTGANPDGSGFPCGADNTGTQAGIKRDEGVVDPAAAGHPLPNGSGDGRALLHSPSDLLFNDVAYARSSGPLNTGDLGFGLKALPFAVDKIVVATAPGGPAPASLTGAQVLKIYNGTYTNWNQVGGKNANIHVYIPKSGSSTRNAFLAFLAGLDNQSEPPGTDNDPASHSAAFATWQGPGNTITDVGCSSATPPSTCWNAGTAPVEEHDPSVLIADPQAIEPFSYGRAQLANKNTTTVRIEGGWSADRELYHVVRGQKIPGAGDLAGDSTPFIWGDTAAGHTDDGGFLEAIFGSDGWLCTNATATQDIADAGFWPLPVGATTGKCGVPNQTTNDTITPGTSAGVDEGAATQTNGFFIAADDSVHISVTASGVTPTGSVQVVVANQTVPGQPSPAADFHKTATLDADGNAVVKLPSTVSGQKTFDISYLPTNFGANSSAGGHSALGASYIEFNAKVPTVKLATTMKATAKPLTLANSTKNTKVTATVKAATGTAKPTGTIKIELGTKTVGKGTLSAGTVTIKVKGTSLKKGKNKLVVTYVPTGSFKAPKTFPIITITRTK